MDQRPRTCKHFGWGVALVAMNLPVSRIALKVASLCVEAPHPELGTVERQRKSIMATLECRLTGPRVGKHSGKYQRKRRDGQQCRSRSKRAVGQARELSIITEAEGGCPDDGASNNKCRGCSKHRPAVR